MNLLITGGAGFLGQHLTNFARESEDVATITATWNQTPAEHKPDVYYHQVDLTSASDCNRLFETIKPTHVIHTAALSQLDICEKYPDLAVRSNVTATQNLLRASEGLPIPPHFTYVSTDLVFSGTQAPYHEDADPDPVQIYGKTKALGESAVRNSPLWMNSCIVRSSLIYGPPIGSRECFLQWMITGLHRGDLDLFSDEIRNPIFVTDLCDALTKVAVSTSNGVYHAAGAESESRLMFGRRAAQVANLNCSSIRGCTRKSKGMDKLRPANVSLSTNRLSNLRWQPTHSADALRSILT